MHPFILERPLIGLDLETTSPVPAKARVCSIALVIFKPDGQVTRWSSLVNPEIPIPREASHGKPGGKYQGHGITDDMVAEKPTFGALAQNLYGGFQHADFAGYNVRFDMQVCANEFKRTAALLWDYGDARVVDGFRLWQVLEPRSLSDASERWLGRKHEGAHDATADLETSLAVITAQVLAGQLPTDLQALHDLCYPDAVDPEGKLKRLEDGTVIITFGQHADTPLTQLPTGYISWMLGADFSETVKRYLREELTRRRSPRPS